jgi:hypothetical protein
VPAQSQHQSPQATHFANVEHGSILEEIIQRDLQAKSAPFDARVVDTDVPAVANATNLSQYWTQSKVSTSDGIVILAPTI